MNGLFEKIFSSFDYVTKGGWVMIPIMGCSVVALGVVMERFFSLRRIIGNTRSLTQNLRALLRRNRLREAIYECDRARSPMALIVKAALVNHDKPKEEIQEAMEKAGQKLTPGLHKHLTLLNTVANISPMLGLFGTVQGMIKCFNVIHAKGGLTTPGDLAEGIANALLTTFWGLVVAIPTLAAYNYFSHKVSNLLHEMEVTSEEFLDLLTGKRGKTHEPPEE